MQKFRVPFIFFNILVAGIIILSSCQGFVDKSFVKDGEPSGNLIIFNAGSLSVPFKQLADTFQQIYPRVHVLAEAGGSVACARKISDLHRECDIMASADYSIIDKMLIPGFASWNIKFASNEMSIVYSDKSRYAREINDKNWYQILMRDDVRFGRSDPNSDPCGYRTVLMLKLAEKYYGKSGLTESFLKKDIRFMRPKEVDLLSLLETNTIDYIFIYRSVAVQHKLRFLNLAEEINLRNPGMSELYNSVSVEINGDKPGKKIIQRGEPAVYGLTILRNAPNKKAAMAFVNFLLSNQKGMKIMEKCGQTTVIPAYSSSFDSIPSTLKHFALSKSAGIP
jgi:molybdate/tungstate transport system substrate-binding protein